MQRMDRLRRSLRDSFRKKRETPESSKPHQWQADEESVRLGNCTFHVKYLGCVEVFESRGMQVCEEAMKVLRQSRRRPVRAILYISGDGLRVVEDDTKGLIVDQTIEKVSFCAPDRNHERGFSYICRDGTTRRWMCHGFLASKDSGERLSHAVGCAFASCLERKQKREKECGVSMTFDPKTSTFTRSGSFRVSTMTDNISDKSISPPPNQDGSGGFFRPAVNPHAIERPHAPVKMLERQGSFRGFSQLANQSPFKRQLSLRLDELPSNLIRAQQNTSEMNPTNNGYSTSTNSSLPDTASPAPPPRTPRNRLHSLPNNSLGGNAPIPESTSINGSGDSRSLLRLENKDLVSELCQQVTQGLSLLAANHDEVKNVNNTSGFSTKFTNPWDDEVGPPTSNFNPSLPILNTALAKSTNINRSNFSNKPDDNWMQNIPVAPPYRPGNQAVSSSSSNNTSKILNTDVNRRGSGDSPQYSSSKFSSSILGRPNLPTSTSNVPTSTNNIPQSSGVTSTTTENVTASPPSKPKAPAPPRPPLMSAASVQQNSTHGLGIRTPAGIVRGGTGRSQSLGADPFDADWAASVARTGQAPTNPFSRQQQQTFQISM